VEDRIGQLIPGRSADLLILDRATLEVRMVMLRGNVIRSQPT